MALSEIEKNKIALLVQDESRKAKEAAEQMCSSVEAASMVKVLTVIAGCIKPVSLRTGAPEEKFYHLRNPDSLKASLYQVINAMRDVFQSGHSSAEKLRNNLRELPTEMHDIMEIMNNLSSPHSKGSIDIALENIKTVTESCIVAADETYEECNKAMKIITELTQAAIAAQSLKESREEANKHEIKAKEAEELQRKSALTELQNLVEAQEKIADEAMEEYRMRMDESSNASKLVGLMLLDSVKSVLETACGAVRDVGNFVKNVPVSTASLAYELAMSKFTNTTYLNKEDIMARAAEQTLFTLLEETTNKTEITPESMASDIDKLQTIMSYKITTETGKMLRDKASELLSALQSHDTPTINVKITEIKAAIEILRITYQRMEATEAATEDSRLKLESIKSQERQSLMLLQQKNLEVARSTMKEERNRAEALRKERLKADEKHLQAVSALKKLNLESEDLKDIIAYLRDGIEQLVQVQVAWEHIKAFFTHIKITVDGPLTRSIDAFTKNTKFIQSNNEIEEYHRKILVRELMKACAVGMVLMQSAEIYKKISDKHVMPTLDYALKNMAMTPENAKAEKTILDSCYNKEKAEVKKAIENHNNKFTDLVNEAIESSGFNLRCSIKD